VLEFYAQLEGDEDYEKRKSAENFYVSALSLARKYSDGTESTVLTDCYYSLLGLIDEDFQIVVELIESGECGELLLDHARLGRELCDKIEPLLPDAFAQRIRDLAEYFTSQT
jgi:hypothetical protein